MFGPVSICSTASAISAVCYVEMRAAFEDRALCPKKMW
jgi:hypothetical protein